jgi:succinate-semialdehyde dehydrogenase / glutarate-semialdehyde dehydrogenase
MPFRAINPYTAELLAEVASLDPTGIEHAVQQAASAQASWRHAPLAQRALLVSEIGRRLRAQRDELAARCTLEMGKTIASARAEVDKCALLCDLAVQLAPRALAPERVTEDSLGAWRVEHQPLGVLLAIMPWNFPYWQALRVIIPNLLAGNAVLHKPASSVPGCAVRLHAVLAEAAEAVGASPALAPLFLVEHDAIPELIADDRIAGVTLTGSEGAGRSVARIAGEHLKKVVLELGGSDPFVVLADADVPRAARAAVKGRTVNAGQSCIAAKRFIVCDAVYDEFLQLFTSEMQALTVGDPTDVRTAVGPLATREIRDALAKQVDASVQAGARIAAQARVPDGPGFFYAPTVLTEIPPHSPAASEELFGPVASVFRAADPEAALTLANATRFGLGASVWTRDAQHAAYFIAGLDAGMVFVNEVVVSDPRVPFGGVKQSGMGRELGTRGFREFTNVKTIRVAE